MRYRVHTLSGSIYIIDTDALTWERNNPKIGILGYDKSRGEMTSLFPIILGESMRIPIINEEGPSVIHTTPVQWAGVIE